MSKGGKEEALDTQVSGTKKTKGDQIGFLPQDGKSDRDWKKFGRHFTLIMICLNCCSPGHWSMAGQLVDGNWTVRREARTTLEERFQGTLG